MRINKKNYFLMLVLSHAIGAESLPTVPVSVVTNAREEVYQNKKGASSLESLIHVTAGKNIVLPIAMGYTNRLVTPFSDPTVISTSLTMADQNGSGEIFIRNNTIYLSTRKDYPVTMFITQRDDEQYAISLTLIPKKIPPREIMFTIDDYALAKVKERTEQRVIKQDLKNDYLAEIKNLLKTVALNEIPLGYSLQKIIKGTYEPPCTDPNLEISFANGQLLVGSNYDLYVGKVTNITDHELLVDERMCSNWEISAVALWPYNQLSSKQSTEIYVVINKEHYSNQGKFRPNLLRAK